MNSHLEDLDLFKDEITKIDTGTTTQFTSRKLIRNCCCCLMRKRNRIRLALLFLLVISFVFVIKFVSNDVSPVRSRSWIILYRILGNDLPPRHSVNQTLTNLFFVLQNEPSFPNVNKIWLLNRIVDEHKEQLFIDLLTRYNQSYIRIPFHWNEYRQIPFSFSPNIPFNSTNLFNQRNSFDKLLLLTSIYHQKILYVMNNNAARNVALKHGKRQSDSQWLMVFDGNCFLSQQGFEQIHQSFLINGSRVQYFIVPMHRLTSNEELFQLKKIRAIEEPQIIFRRDSTIEYLETMRYGRRSKEELLAYLGVRQLNRRSMKERKPGKNKPTVQFTSFVFRLYSGLNPNNERSIVNRGCTRYQGILLFLQQLDMNLTRRSILPPISKTTSQQCLLWSDQQLMQIIRLAQQRHNSSLANELFS